MLRLTGGIFRGRMIQTPAHNQTRPSQARLRQALFNSLQAFIENSKVLDLFAGSGALGFEALSRGADSVTFVENSRSAIKIIQKNIETLEVKDRTRLITESVETGLKSLVLMESFDLILIDPPYEEGWESKLLENWPWDKLLSPGGHLCLEWGQQKSLIDELPNRPPWLAKVREKNYGDSILTTYTRTETRTETEATTHVET